MRHVVPVRPSTATLWREQPQRSGSRVLANTGAAVVNLQRDPIAVRAAWRAAPSGGTSAELLPRLWKSGHKGTPTQYRRPRTAPHVRVEATERATGRRMSAGVPIDLSPKPGPDIPRQALGSVVVAPQISAAQLVRMTQLVPHRATRKRMARCLAASAAGAAAQVAHGAAQHACVTCRVTDRQVAVAAARLAATASAVAGCAAAAAALDA